MKFVLIDKDTQSRAGLAGRVAEALRQAELHSVEVVELDLARIETFDWADVGGCLVGPSCSQTLEDLIDRLRLMFHGGEIGIVLDTEEYATHAVTWRKRFGAQILPLSDLAQLASFLIDCEMHSSKVQRGEGGGRVVGLAHLKGGVGTTTLTAAFASCWARNGLSVVAIDFDDVNPQLTAWARVGIVQRTVTAELLRQGEVPASRINEMLHPVEGFEGRFVVIGQPEAYNESFHFKANVLEGAPSASEFVQSLMPVLQSEFDVIVIDMARSWGVATFSALPLCDQVILVTDDDGMSVRRSLDAFARLRHESDDPEEFNLSRWSLILNGYTGRLISPKEIANEIQEMGLFSAEASLYTVPFSDTGRQWGAPGQSLYETADTRTRQIIRRIACNLVPFRYEPEQTFSSKLLKRFHSLVSP